MFKSHIDGSLYVGDMQPGDREATPEEVTAWQTPTPYQEEEIKRKLLAEAMPRRDTLLLHLRWFYIKAVEERAAAAPGAPLIAAQAKVTAIETAITSLQTMFNDTRVVNAIDGAVAGAVKTVYLEIFAALGAASPATFYAVKALDPL
jgi:hypothetical protein